MIKKLKMPFAAILTLAVLASVPGIALAQSTADKPQSEGEAKSIIKVAVVDIQFVRTNAAAMKNIRAQMTKYRDDIQGDIQKEEVELRKANDELVRKRSIMEPAAFEAERKKFEERVVSLQRHVQRSKQALDNVQAEAIVKVDKMLLEVIAGIVKDEGLTLVFHKSATVVSVNSLNISNLALKRLDEKVSTITVAVPDNAKK